MAVPLKYNLRNLFVRKFSTGMTILGVALVVMVFLLVLSLAEGVRKTLTTNVSPLNVVVMRVGAQSDVQSFIENERFAVIQGLPGIARDAQGQPLVSPEVVPLINVPRKDGKKTNVVVRGVLPAAFGLRPMRIVEGRMFREGTSEAIVSRRTQQRFAGMEIGDTVKAGSEKWTIVGVFDANGSPQDSEIWGDLHDVQSQSKRTGGYSIVRVRTPDRAARDRFIAAVKGDQQVKLDAKPEDVYYAEQMGTAKPLQFLAYFVGILMAVGASFGAMNTMYAQVSARTREVATLRALGFRRWSILASFILESVLIALIGGAVGAALAVGIVNTVLSDPTGTNNFNTFAEILFNFRLTPELIAGGMVFSLAIGLFGGFFPAARAARLKIVNALREA
ncbi:MAG TPA: ABC transporter permease [Candidatus Polarisedimenticolia bacterium]|jgi:ABC-type antimicrobial peptide transport system permease subunit|nr:ABC transporter permease [Candidatus Polarisedimenticolia bacterium]